MTLNGKVALVTGGGRGIGAVTSTLLAARGASVIVNYRGNRDAAEQVVEGIRAAGGGARSLQADVLLLTDVSRMIEEILQAYHQIDILVSNAGLPFVRKPLLEMTWEEA